MLVYIIYVCLFFQVGDRLLAVNGKLATNTHESSFIYTYTHMYTYNGGMKERAGA